MRKLSRDAIKVTITIRETGPILWVLLSVPGKNMPNIMSQKNSNIHPDAIIYEADWLKFGASLFKHLLLFT